MYRTNLIDDYRRTARSSVTSWLLQDHCPTTSLNIASSRQTMIESLRSSWVKNAIWNILLQCRWKCLSFGQSKCIRAFRKSHSEVIRPDKRRGIQESISTRAYICRKSEDRGMWEPEAGFMMKTCSLPWFSVMFFEFSSYGSRVLGTGMPSETSDYPIEVWKVTTRYRST